MYFHYVLLSMLTTGFAVPMPAPAEADPPPKHECQEDEWIVNRENYKKYRATGQLQTYWQGGMDIDGIQWPGVRDQTDDFSAAFGSDMFDTPWSCKDILNPCDLDQTHCYDVGALNEWHNKVESHWGWQIANAMSKMSKMMSTVYQLLDSVSIKASVKSMDAISTFLPSPEDEIYDASVKGRGPLIGLSFVASTASVIPQLSATLRIILAIFSASTTVSQSSMALAIADQTLRTLVFRATEFAELVGNVTETMQKNLADYAQTMFGAVVNPIDYSNNLFEALGHPDDPIWIDADPADVNHIKDALFRVVLSSVLNSVWKSRSVFVTFADLDDDDKGTKCEADEHGPGVTKYCADGGVYYTHRWDGKGQYAEIWGIDKLKDSQYRIDPKWITESSAKAYRLQLKNNKDPFDSDDEDDTLSETADTVNAFADSDGLELLPRLPGVWSLPVCDMGPHVEWNTDWSQSGMDTFVAPCYCGPNGKYTKPFYETMLNGTHDCGVTKRCTWQNHGLFHGHHWPEELTTDKVDYGFGEIHEGRPYDVYGGECER